MIHPPSPPHGVFIPGYLIFHPELPTAVLVTWIQLRSLAGDSRRMPSTSLPDLASKLGIHPNRLYRHMSSLQELSALSLYEMNQGKFVISFPEQPSHLQKGEPRVKEGIEQPFLDSKRSIQPAPSSYFPARILGYLSFEDNDKDPLHMEQDQEILRRENIQETSELSKFVTCRPVEHALVAK